MTRIGSQRHSKKKNLQEISIRFRLIVKGINIQTRVLNHKGPTFQTRIEHRFWTTGIMSRSNTRQYKLYTHTNTITGHSLPWKMLRRERVVTGPHQRQIARTYSILVTIKAE